MNDVGAILLSAFVAGAVAVWGILSQRAIARRKATLDYLTRQESDGDIIEARKNFIGLAKNGGLAKWAEEENEKSNETNSIRIVLNEMELISIGIQRGVIDYEMFRRWNRSGVLRYWQHSAPFIHVLRSRLNNDAIYHEFEQMAVWLKDNKMPRRNRWVGKLF